MGQSLLMLPADIIGTGLARLPVFSGYGDTDPTVRSILVSYTTNILISVLTALITLRLLLQLRFSTGEAIAGVSPFFLPPLICTTRRT